MILFTGGFPYSGKSTFVSSLCDKLSKNNIDILVLNPKDYYPDNFKQLSENEKIQFSTAAWEECLVQAELLTKTKDNSILIILDTAAKKLQYMEQIFKAAKRNDHTTYFAYINTKVAICKTRSKNDGQNWNDNFWQDYIDNFKITIPALKKLSDYFYIIDNHQALLEVINNII